MRIYLDTCSLGRPLDTRNQIRIALEAEAILGVLALFESGKLELISSDVLLFEVRRDPNETRQEYASEVLSRAGVFVGFSQEVTERAKAFSRLGVKPLDSMHLACAEWAQADYFCTCDDKLLRRARTIRDLRIKMVSPIEMIEEFERYGSDKAPGRDN